jgi:hypothetical protein
LAAEILDAERNTQEHEDAGNPNECALVWQGAVQQRAFQGFSTQTARSKEAARKLLEGHGVAHYWDAAESFVPDLAPAPAL